MDDMIVMIDYKNKTLKLANGETVQVDDLNPYNLGDGFAHANESQEKFHAGGHPGQAPSRGVVMTKKLSKDARRILDRVAFISEKHRVNGIGRAYIDELLIREGYCGEEEKARYERAWGVEWSD